MQCWQQNKTCHLTPWMIACLLIIQEAVSLKPQLTGVIYVKYMMELHCLLTIMRCMSCKCLQLTCDIADISSEIWHNNYMCKDVHRVKIWCLSAGLNIFCTYKTLQRCVYAVLIHSVFHWVVVVMLSLWCEVVFSPSVHSIFISESIIATSPLSKDVSPV